MSMAYMVVLATTVNYGKNIGEWALDNIWWFIMVAGIAVAGFAGVKKSWVACGLTIVITAISLYLIDNPTKLADLGDTLANIINL